MPVAPDFPNLRLQSCGVKGVHVSPVTVAAARMVHPVRIPRCDISNAPTEQTVFTTSLRIPTRAEALPSSPGHENKVSTATADAGTDNGDWDWWLPSHANTTETAKRDSLGASSPFYLDTPDLFDTWPAVSRPYTGGTLHLSPTEVNAASVITAPERAWGVTVTPSASQHAIQHAEHVSPFEVFKRPSRFNI